MADTSALISLKTAVSSFFNRSPMDSSKFMEKMMAIAVECLGDLNIYHTKQLREAYLEVSSVNLVNLPPDYIDFARPPSIIAGNRIHELSEDSGIPLNPSIDCGSPTNAQPIGVGDDYSLYEGYNGSYGMHQATNVGFYRIDKEARIIRLRGSIPSNIIYLEYLSTGVSLDGATMIDRRLLSVIRNYLIWQSIENSPTIGRNEKDAKQDQYEKSLEAYWHWKQDLSISGLLETIRSKYSQSAKG